MKPLLFRDIHNKEVGFTLMELLISITIIMAIVAIVGSAFRLGFKAVEKGENNIDEQRRYMTAVNYIYHQLEAVSLNENAVFQGEKDQIVFHYMLNGSVEGENTKEITYRLARTDDEKGDDLEVAQKNAFPLTKQENKEQVYTLLSGIRDFSLAYLKKTGKGALWLDEWKDEIYFPRAVKMEFIYLNRPALIFVRLLKNKRKEISNG